MLKTPLQQQNYGRIPGSAEVAQFLEELSARTPWAQKIVLGSSVLGSPINALLLSKPAPTERPARLRLMLVGSQHGASEPAGCDALLGIACELVRGNLGSVLADLEILIVPNANPDGRDLDRSANANKVNLNRDFLLLSQPESRALNDALIRFAPDVVLDVHESASLKRKSLAREGYLTDFEAQFDVANCPALPRALYQYGVETLVPEIVARVNAQGLRAQRYIREIKSVTQVLTHGDLTLRTLRNKAGLSGAISVLLENRVDPSDGSYPTYRNIGERVEKQLLCIRNFIRLIHESRAAIEAAVQTARQTAHVEPLALSADYVEEPTQPRITVQLRQLETRDPVRIEFPNHRALQIRELVPLQETCIITAHMAMFRDLLERHGIQFSEMTGTRVIRATVHRFTASSEEKQPFALAASSEHHVEVPPGSLAISLRQSHGRLVRALLEPRSNSSVFRYPSYARLLQPEQEFFIYSTGEL